MQSGAEAKGHISDSREEKADLPLGILAESDPCTEFASIDCAKSLRIVPDRLSPGPWRHDLTLSAIALPSAPERQPARGHEIDEAARERTSHAPRKLSAGRRKPYALLRTMRRLFLSKRSLIAPVRSRRVASGLIIDSVVRSPLLHLAGRSRPVISADHGAQCSGAESLRDAKLRRAEVFLGAPVSASAQDRPWARDCSDRLTRRAGVGASLENRRKILRRRKSTNKSTINFQINT